ncbi:MAG: multidrug effflux MFS transporter [Candidatus Nanopelagicales bacterium]
MNPETAASAPPKHLVLVLAGLSALVVLTTDVYLPVLPQLGADLGTSDAAAAATLSASLLGVALAQVVVGPISDATGRRRPLLLGLAAYAVTHLLCALAPNLPVLLGLRFLSGIATAAVMVVARAVVADVYPGREAARAFATLGAVFGIVPVIAPVLGGLLAHVMSWRGMFLVLAGIGLVLVPVTSRLVPESLPPGRRIPPHVGAVVKDLAEVLTHRRFLAYAVAMAAAGAMLFGYIGASSFVLQNHFGLSPQGYSYVFALNSLGFFGVSWLARSLVVRTGPNRLLLVGQVGAVVAAGVVALGVATVLLPVVVAGLFLMMCSFGLVMPMATAIGMHEAPGRAGSAAGVLGISQFLVGAVATPLAGLGGSPWSMAAVIGVAAVLGLVLRLLLVAGTTPEPGAE